MNEETLQAMKKAQLMNVLLEVRGAVQSESRNKRHGYTEQHALRNAHSQSTAALKPSTTKGDLITAIQRLLEALQDNGCSLDAPEHRPLDDEQLARFRELCGACEYAVCLERGASDKRSHYTNPMLNTWPRMTYLAMLQDEQLRGRHLLEVLEFADQFNVSVAQIQP